jgi:hypothetical protein
MTEALSIAYPLQQHALFKVTGRKAGNPGTTVEQRLFVSAPPTFANHAGGSPFLCPAYFPPI